MQVHVHVPGLPGAPHNLAGSGRVSMGFDWVMFLRHDVHACVLTFLIINIVGRSRLYLLRRCDDYKVHFVCMSKNIYCSTRYYCIPNFNIINYPVLIVI